VWVPSVHGDLAADGESSRIDLGFGDEFALAFAVPAHLEASYRDLSVFVDVLYIKVKTGDEGSGPTSHAEAGIGEIGGAWRVYDSAPSIPDPAAARWTIEPLLGLRYYGASVGVEVPQISFDETVRKDWLDVFAGARVGFAPSENWRFGVRGDVAAGSSFTWNVLGDVEWSIADWFALSGGYRVFDIDYRSGGSEDRFEFNVQLRGPFLSAIFRF
jgi:hypothetical protein